MKVPVIFEDPECLAFRNFLIEEKLISLKDPVYLEDIEEKNYDFYGGSRVFEYEGIECAIIPDDDIEQAFKEYAENLVDDCIIPELPQNLQAYFDYEKFIRDMSFDGYGQMSGYDGNDNEIRLINGDYYHVLRMN